MVTYFGHTTEHGDFYGDANAYSNDNVTFTCPGSGSQTLVSLGVYAKKSTGDAGLVRVAIYTAALAFVAQGSAAISVSSTDASWVEHTSFTNYAGNPITPTLTGGDNYVLIFDRSTDQVLISYEIGTSGDYDITDPGDAVASGFPETITQSNPTAVNYSIRAGVEAAASGSTASILASLNRRRRS